jgi:hypothetical protein
MRQRRNLAVGAIALLLLACKDERSEPITSPRIEVPPVAQAETSPSEARLYTDARANFHAKNYADWVGKAHNKALDDFFAATIAQTGDPENLCSRILDFMSEPGRIPPDKDQGTRERRRAFAGAALSGTQMCQGQLAENPLPKLWLASAIRGVSSSASVGSISAAANYLLDQIRNAQAMATTATGLATALTPILSQADQLVSSERDIVYAAASVSQSSFEYWQANLQPLGDQVAVTHGGCLVQYPDEPYALNTCMGITGAPAPIQPTSYRKLGNTTHFLYDASRQTTTCSSVFDLGAAVEMDFQGAVVGGLLGWALSPPAILVGAVGGGASASLAVGAWQTARYAWCKVRGGGGGGKTGPKPT